MSSSCRKELYLPHECWELVLKLVPELEEQEEISLVSKQFLCITNNLRSSITLHSTTPLDLLPRLLFTRFPNLTSLTTHFLSISVSDHSSTRFFDLALHKNNSTTPFKSISLTDLLQVTDDDLVLLSQCFSSVQQLKFTSANFYQGDVTDIGVRAFSMGLIKLRKVILGVSFVSDSVLVILCKHAPLLEKVIINGLYCITSHGIASAIKEVQNLITFSASGHYFQLNSEDLIASLMGLSNITFLDLSYSVISDELLVSIAKKHLLLRKLVLRRCHNFTYVGLSSLLFKCRFVEHLDLQSTEFLEDQHITELSMYLSSLKYINLTDCVNITDLGLSALTRNCPLLNQMITYQERPTWMAGLNRFCCKLSIQEEDILSDECECNCEYD